MKIVVKIISGFLFLVGAGCAYNDLSSEFNCSTSDLDLTISFKIDATSCKAIDGSISVTGSGGEEPYNYNLNGGEYQTSSEFDRLAPGSYTIIVKDFNGCKKSLLVDVGAANSNLAATSSTQLDNQCFIHNGSATITANGGTSPYLYKINDGDFASLNTFANLKNGQYTVIVKDANDCQKVVSVVVPRGSTETSYASDIQPIFEVKCNLSGCHDSGTGSRDWTKFSNIKSKAGSIKARTANRSMPVGGLLLTQQQIDIIGCWVDDGAPNN